MKRVVLLIFTLMLALAAEARPVRLFTPAQAARTVKLLGAQNELMIYCGYDYEVETYVLVSDVWAERINSTYSEIWVYGYDAYTGDEVYMPLDLGCVWLVDGRRVYNAAEALRFRVTVRPIDFAWYVPPYNPYSRVKHASHYSYTYHYHVHQVGWMPPVVGSSHPGPGVPPPTPVPPYYNRRPTAPAPAPTVAWTPGNGKPQLSSQPVAVRQPLTEITTVTHSSHDNASSTTRSGNATATTGTTRSGGNTTATTSTTRSGGNTTATTGTSRSGGNTTATTGTRSTSTSATTTNTRSGNTARPTSTTPSRSTTPTTDNTRSSATSSTTNTRSGSTTTGTTNTRSTTSGTTNTRSTTTGTTNTRSGSTTATTNSRSTTTTNTRSNSTTNTRSSSTTSGTRSGSSRTR